MQNAQLDMVTPLRVRPYCVIERSKQMRTVRRDVNDSGENDFFIFIFTTVLPQCIFPHGKFGLLSSGKAGCDKVVLPNQRCMPGDLVFP